MISPRNVGVTICVFLLSDIYLFASSLVMIPSLVALVPMPAPFICSRRSSSSMNCPAFSIVRMRDPELYLLGGDVSPSFISMLCTLSLSPFLTFARRSINSWLYFGSSFFFEKLLAETLRYPSLMRYLKLANNFSPFFVSVIATF